MPRFFAAGSNIGGGIAVLGGSDAAHVRALRIKIGDSLIVCDGEGTDYHCRLTREGSGAYEAEILSSEPSPAEPSVSCAVFAGMPKGERADYAVQKCVEAGAESITFFVSERSVSRPDEKTMGKKSERWQRIAEEAAKQSGRGKIPEVRTIYGTRAAFEAASGARLKLFLYEEGERVPLREAMKSAGEIDTAAIFTGPEGGFEPSEVELARAYGADVCSMGPRILRCETAPVIALAALMYETGNL